MLIKTVNLKKIYKSGNTSVNALKGVNVSIERGETVAIMGPSGSGKSTFMNIIGCLDRPSEGSYILEGKDVSSLSVNQLASIRSSIMGFVFQSFNLIPGLDALANVELPLIYGSVPTKKRRMLAKEALRMVGLEKRERHFPSQLSGGQQQRVAIARAIVHRPKILLADEPTGNLDSATSAEIMELFIHLNRTENITLIVVTHEGEIASYCNRTIFFRDGRVKDSENPKKP